MLYLANTEQISIVILIQSYYIIFIFLQSSMHKNSLFIFRQDFRIHDNTGLIKAITASETVLPIFIFDTTILSQFPPHDARLTFILQALHALDTQLKTINSHLTIYHGDPKQIIPQLVEQYNIDAIYRNESYGHGAIHRDAWLQDRCRTHAVACDASHDYLLVPIDYTPARKVFTPFYKLRQTYFEHNKPTVNHHTPTTQTPKTEGLSRAQLENLLGVQVNRESDIDTSTSHHSKQDQKNNHSKNHDANPRPVKLGTDRLEQFNFNTYDETRNFPAVDGSSRLSPYTRFGLVSIREVYCKALEQDAQVYISELAWREFWQHIYYNFSYSRDHEFQQKRRYIQRDNNEYLFEARKNGMT